jgi:signal transduction histidine kinase
MRLSRHDAVAAGFALLTAFVTVWRSATAGGDWLAFGAVAGLAVGAGWPRLFGRQWRDASWPVGCSVAIPILCVPMSDVGGSSFALSLMLPAVGALPLASLLASRHADRHSADWLFGVSVATTLGVGLLTLVQPDAGFGGVPFLPYLLMGLVALLPALGVVLDPAATPPGEVASRFTDRLSLVALGATPGAAMTVLPGSQPTLILFVAWVVALVIWRRFTIAPLLRVTARTQQERDLTVSAIEAERARIAADLHDDALQELTALVRRLDAAGDTEGAELARGVAERLRVICSDLRLPLLDDLGAGAALEWLVARIRPMAAGEVRLERLDPTRPPSGVELAVFRIAQEALANAVRHGKPPITVRYRVDESGHVSLSVDDVGRGIQPGAAEQALAAGHLGLANMQQRAEQIGALLDVRRWPSGGTHVALEWRSS